MELYNLGIGLSAVDRASGPINNVDKALIALRKNVLESSEQSLPKLVEHVGEVGASLRSMSDDGRKTAFEVGQFTTVWGKLGSVVSFGTRMLGQAADSIERLSILGDEKDTVLGFEDATTKLAIGLGRTSNEARGLRSNVLDLVNSTQFSVDEVSTLASELGNTGQVLTSFSSDTQGSMVELRHIFGVTGEDIGRMATLTDQFGGSLGETLDEAAVFQRSFGIPGIFKELPGIVDFARDSFIKYGAQVTGGSRAIITNTEQMAGVYAKAFGKTISEAVSSARETLGRFMDASRNFRRVFLGLDSDFDPLTQAFQQVGVPLFQVQGLVQQAQTDVLGFARRTRGVLSTLDPWRRNRFIEQLRDELPADLMALITDMGAFNKAVADQQRVAATQTKLTDEQQGAFRDLSTGMLDTTKEMQSMWFNVKQGIKVLLLETGVVDTLRVAFDHAKTTLADWNTRLKAFLEGAGVRRFVDRMVPALGDITGAVLVGGKALGVLASAWGGVGAAVVGGGGALVALNKVSKFMYGRGLPTFTKTGEALAAMSTSFKAAAGRAFVFARRMLPVAGTISGVYTALMDMGETLGDPSATGFEKFSAIVRGSLKGVAKAANVMLLGIPGMLADRFFPDLERQFDKGFAGIMDRVGDFDLAAIIETIWDKTTTFLGTKIRGLGKYLATNAPDFAVTVQSWGRTLGGAVGGLAISALELIWTSIRGLLYDIPKGIVDWAYSTGDQAVSAAGQGMEDQREGILSVIGGIIGDAGGILISGFQGIGEGILGALGSSGQEARLGFAYMWNGVKEMGLDVVFGITQGFQRLGVMAMTTAADLGRPIVNAFISMYETGKFVWDEISKGGDRLTTTLKLAFMQFGKEATKVFIGEGGVVQTVLGGFRSMLQGIYGVTGSEKALEGIAAIDKAFNGLNTTTENLDRNISAAQKVLADSSGVGADFAQVQDRIKKKQDEVNNAFWGFTNVITDAESNTRGLWGELDKGLDEERGTIERSMNAEKERLRAQQAMFGAARRFQVDKRAGYDDVFAKLREEAGGKLTVRQMDVAQRSLTSVLDESLRGIATRVREGVIDVNAAEVEFSKAAEKAIVDAVSAAKGSPAEAAGGGRAGARLRAGDVAGRAQAPAFIGGGVTPEMWRGLMAAAQGAGARPQQLAVTFRGVGSDVDKALADKARVSKLKRGN